MEERFYGNVGAEIFIRDGAVVGCDSVLDSSVVEDLLYNLNSASYSDGVLFADKIMSVEA